MNAQEIISDEIAEMSREAMADAAAGKWDEVMTDRIISKMPSDLDAAEFAALLAEIKSGIEKAVQYGIEHGTPSGKTFDELFGESFGEEALESMKAHYAEKEIEQRQSLIADAAKITVINDGQVRFPVLTAELKSWVEKNGEITNDNYETFCDQVDYLGAQISTPGNAGMIELCEALIEAGADLEQLG